MSAYALELKDVTKNYPDFTLDRVSLCVPKGNIVGLVGENGAGKTTTINIILNEVAKGSGEVKVFGKDSTTLEKEIKSDIGVVLDECLFPDIFTVNEIEHFASKVYLVWEHQTFQRFLKLFELPSDKPIKTFSNGMKVKLGFAVALSHRPKLLILDEATSGLDPIMRDEILDILLDFVQDETHSVLLSTHITSDLEKIADYITFILDGQIVFTGSKESLLESYVLVKGGLNEINPQQKKLIIGLREHNTGFEGMTETENLRMLPKSLLTEPITLDEIIIYMNKGAKFHE